MVVEAGVPMSAIRNALEGGFKRVAGAVISHRHGDHAKSVKDLLLSGTRVLAANDVFSSIGMENDPCAFPISPEKCYVIGKFRVIAFPVKHDVPCYGFIITHPEMGRLLFVTDTMAVSQKMPQGISQVMIETNYADDILDSNIESGAVPVAMRKRLMLSHMELGTAKKILSRMDLSSVQNIILIHLSSSNSDESRFVREMETHTGKRVFAADEGRVFDLSLEPY